MSLTIFHGDCLEVMKTLPDKSVDCFICDLPYGCLSTTKQPPLKIDKHSVQRSGCAWDIKIDLGEFWKQVKRLCKTDKSPVLMFCTTKFGIDLINSNPSWFRYDLVWDKKIGVSFLSANKMPLRAHEMIYVFSKSGAHYKRIDIEGDFKKWSSSTRGISKHYHNKERTAGGGDHTEGKRCVKSVIPIQLVQHKGGHPTEKPLELYKWLLSRYCPEGGTILDPTAGSFNSCVAGLLLDLNCIGIEKDNEFFNKALKDFEECCL